jgi:hypothetical protein
LIDLIDLLCLTPLSAIFQLYHGDQFLWRGFVPGFVIYTKGCTRLTAARDKVYELLSHGRWFSPGTPASSTTKTGRHDIAEILLKVVLNIGGENAYTNKGKIIVEYLNTLSKGY